MYGSGTAASITKPFSALTIGAVVANASAAASTAAAASSANAAHLLAQSQAAISTLSPSFNTTGIAFHSSVFQSHLTTALIGRSFLLLPVTDSTMIVSRKLVELGCVSGSVVVAERQLAGRGRGDGRVWASAPKGNLYFNVLLEALTPIKLPLINFALPIAVCKACEAVGVRTARVKWPNDVWCEGKKLSGMLADVEQKVGGDGDDGQHFYVHCGIGINVNEEMSSSSSAEVRAVATSIRDQIPNHSPVSRELVLATFCNELERRLLSCSTLADLMEEYERYDLLKGEKIIVMPKKREDAASHYEAICLGYTADGFMKVKREKEQKEILLVSEEVSVRSALLYYEEKEREKKSAAAKQAS